MSIAAVCGISSLDWEHGQLDHSRFFVGQRINHPIRIREFLMSFNRSRERFLRWYKGFFQL